MCIFYKVYVNLLILDVVVWVEFVGTIDVIMFFGPNKNHKIAISFSFSSLPSNQVIEANVEEQIFPTKSLYRELGLVLLMKKV